MHHHYHHQCHLHHMHHLHIIQPSSDVLSDLINHHDPYHHQNKQIHYCLLIYFIKCTINKSSVSPASMHHLYHNQIHHQMCRMYQMRLVIRLVSISSSEQTFGLKWIQLLCLVHHHIIINIIIHECLSYTSLPA